MGHFRYSRDRKLQKGGGMTMVHKAISDILDVMIIGKKKDLAYLTIIACFKFLVLIYS